MQEHNIISFSGGKDSTALLLLAIEQQPENLQVVFCDTGNEHRQTYEYVMYVEAATGVPIRHIKADFTHQIEGKRRFVETAWREQGVPEDIVRAALEVLVPTGNPFLDLCIWKGRFPSRKAQFCTEQLKREPFNKQIVQPLLEQGDEVIAWHGVRRDESENRRKLPANEDKGGGYSIYRPILDWTADDAFDMHRKHSINPNPLYLQGMGRVGCMPCINCNKDELLEIAKRFPDEVERIVKWEQVVSQACKRGFSTFFHKEYGDFEMNELTAEEVFRQHNISQTIKWSKTSRGGRQFNMFRAEAAPVHSCSSLYAGLCE